MNEFYQNAILAPFSATCCVLLFCVFFFKTIKQCFNIFV